jgi:hypothetical protein
LGMPSTTRLRVFPQPAKHKYDETVDRRLPYFNSIDTDDSENN